MAPGTSSSFSKFMPTIMQVLLKSTIYPYRCKLPLAYLISFID